MALPEISYFEYPEQHEELPDEFGMLLPVLENVTGCIVNDDHNVTSTTITRNQINEQGRISEENNHENGDQADFNAAAEENNDTSLLYNHGPLYEDDLLDFPMHFVNVKRKAVRDYSVGNCRDKSYMIGINSQINVNVDTALESVIDLRTLQRDKKKPRYSSDLINATQNNVISTHLHDEDMHMENSTLYYTKLTDVQYLQASVLLEEGVVMSTVVDIPNKNIVYRHRHGTWKVLYYRYKMRVIFLILLTGIVCIGLGLSGQITTLRQGTIAKSENNNVNDDKLSIMPSNAPNPPTFEPTSGKSNIYWTKFKKLF